MHSCASFLAVRAPERRLPSPSPTSSQDRRLRRTRGTRPSSSRARRTQSASRARLTDLTPEACTSPWTYSSLAEGSHSFSVQAEDGVSPPSEPAPWTWTVDLTPPSLPGDKTVEATSPLGTAVTFSATDNFDPPPDLSCSPSSGSLFDLGPPASVDCTATDAAGNHSSGSFTVTVVDTTRPVLSPHKDVIVKVQDSLSEAVVQYNLPLATDNGDPAPVVGCNPSSGSIFQLGTTKVTCSAVDGSGNHSASRRFDVVVQHGPAPAVPLLTSNVGALTNNTNVGFSFETSDGASLACKLDRPSGPGTFASCTSQQTYTQLGDGSYLFTVQATNSIGNISVASFSWVVDTTPPAQVRQLRSSFGNGWVRLSWRNPTDVDYKRVLIWRRKVGASSWRFLATRKGRTTFLDDTVPNDTRFEYRLRSVDRARNASPGAKIEGRASRILKPAFGSLHNSPPAYRLDICSRRRLLQPATVARWAQDPERLAREVGQAAARELEIQRRTLLASKRSLPRLCLGGLRVQSRIRTTGHCSAGPSFG